MKGYFRKRGEKWSFSIDLPRDPVTNQRKQKTVSGFKTKKEAEKACAALITQIEQDEYVEPTKQTVAEFVCSWLSGKELSLKDTTFTTYSSLINQHIIPVLGKYELKKLTRDHIIDFYKSIKTEKDLSDRTLFDIHRLLSRIISKAVDWQMLPRNVVATVDTPLVAKKQVKVWTLEECLTFLEFAQSDRLYVAFLLALTTGMREGEVLGLRWKDIDFEANTISISQTLSRLGNKLQDGTKTNAGSRKISIDDTTATALKKHKKKIMEEKFKLGPSYDDLDLVVATSLGTPTGSRNLLRSFYRLMDKAGVPKIKFHDLRHTHATLLLAQSVNPKIVSERLGHANVKITLDIYSHVLPNMQRDTADEFGRIFYNKEVATDKQGGQNVVK